MAVRLFNDPGQPRALEGFIVHMHIAWLYYFQSKWMKEGREREYLVRESDKPVRYKKVDGEHMSQPLEWFVRNEYPAVSAVSANIDFFIRLRNKIEHRHTGSPESLQVAVRGECHSLLLNYEEALVALGGSKESLAHILHFPVFIGGFTDKGKADLLKMTKSLPADLRNFIADYDNSLDDDVARDPRYCMRLTVILENGNRKGDVSMKFFNLAELTDEEQAVVEKIAEKGFVVTKRKRVSVSNADNFKPSQVVEQVQAEIPFVFNMSHFTAAWKIGKFRPATGSASPDETRTDFCVYDAPHRDYTYTPVYVKHLAAKCSTAEGFLAITGKAPKLKAA